MHGTDTLAYTASALSLMLAGFRKPIVITGEPTQASSLPTTSSWSMQNFGWHGDVCAQAWGFLLTLSLSLGAGSQVPLTLPRSDARQNLVDALTCATSFFNPPHVLLQVLARCRVKHRVGHGVDPSHSYPL